MEKFKKILAFIGLILLPAAFIVWMLDRVIMVIMPKTDHKNFGEWLRTEEITTAVVRLIIIMVARWLISLIFNV